MGLDASSKSDCWSSEDGVMQQAVDAARYLMVSSRSSGRGIASKSKSNGFRGGCCRLVASLLNKVASLGLGVLIASKRENQRLSQTQQYLDYLGLEDRSMLTLADRSCWSRPSSIFKWPFRVDSPNCR